MWGNSGQPLIQSRPVIRSKLDVVGNIFCRFCMGKYHLIKSIGMQLVQLTQYVRKYLMRIVKWKMNNTENDCDDIQCGSKPVLLPLSNHTKSIRTWNNTNNMHFTKRLQIAAAKISICVFTELTTENGGPICAGRELNTYHYIKHIYKLHRAHLFWCNIMKIVSKSFNNKKKTCSIYKLTIYSYS